MSNYGNGQTRQLAPKSYINVVSDVAMSVRANKRTRRP